MEFCTCKGIDIYIYCYKKNRVNKKMLKFKNLTRINMTVKLVLIFVNIFKVGKKMMHVKNLYISSDRSWGPPPSLTMDVMSCIKF